MSIANWLGTKCCRALEGQCWRCIYSWLSEAFCAWAQREWTESVHSTSWMIHLEANFDFSSCLVTRMFFFFLDFRSTLKGFNYTFLHDTTFYSRPDSDCKWLHGNVSGLSIEVNTHHRGRCVVFIKGCFFLLLWIKESHTTSYCQCHLTKSQQHVGHNYRALGRNPCLKLALRMH